MRYWSRKDCPKQPKNYRNCLGFLNDGSCGKLSLMKKETIEKDFKEARILNALQMCLLFLKLPKWTKWLNGPLIFHRLMALLLLEASFLSGILKDERIQQLHLLSCCIHDALCESACIVMEGEGFCATNKNKSLL